MFIKTKKHFQVPVIKYTDDNIVGNSFLVYSCVPEFIKEPKLLSIDNFLIGLDGDFYNDFELMGYFKRSKSYKIRDMYIICFKKKGPILLIN